MRARPTPGRVSRYYPGMSFSTLIRVAAIASLLVVPLSCCVTTGVLGAITESDNGRETLKPAGRTVRISSDFQTLGGLHRVEEVSAIFVHEDGTQTELGTSVLSSTDWGPVITTEVLTKYGIPLTDGQKDAEIRINVAPINGSPPPGADGELRVTGRVRLPYVPAGSKDEFMEKVQRFQHTSPVRIGGEGIAPTPSERAGELVGMLILGLGSFFVLLSIVNVFWPKPAGDPRTDDELIAVGRSGEALPKGVAS